MARRVRARLTQSLRGFGTRQLRLICGVILFSYLVSHFVNHALGNISLDVLADGLDYHMMFWQWLPVAIMFYTAALLHAGLGIWALYERRQFRWKALEPLQLTLGLSIPALVIAHIVNMRLSYTLFEQDRAYPQVLYGYWVLAPYRIWLMFSLLLIAWIHGSIGLYFWLRMKVWFQRSAPLWLSIAVLIPTLAMLGLYQAGRAVEEDSTVAEWKADNLARQYIGTPAEQATLDAIIDYFLIGYLALLLLVLAARGVRALLERRGGMIRLSYGHERSVQVPRGLSVLEASLRHNIPHASVCGGRARCSTCRIRVIGDPASLPAPSLREAFVLDRLGSGGDPAVRLACQLRPDADLAFFQIFQPQQALPGPRAAATARTGEERYLVSMFVDMRGSTKLAEHRLPFDTVFIVNRFLDAVARAVTAAGGRTNQFVGDGLLALFGLACNPQTACRQAIEAAALIGANVTELNRFLSHDLAEPIRFGIGIHGGEVIIGDIGARDHMVFTALGDAVNVAARLQELTKPLACEAVLSDEVCTTAGLPATSFVLQQVEIRGRSEPMQVCAITVAEELSALIESIAVD